MIDIFCNGGSMYSVQMSFDTMLHIMEDSIIGPDDFIPIIFSDGEKGAVRKGYINMFCEHIEGDEASREI